MDSLNTGHNLLSNSSGSCKLPKRKLYNSLAMANSLRKVYGPKAGNVSSVKERVLSAKMLKLRTLQNQLNDANARLIETMQENKMLKTLQQRQDRALVKYEASNADLPRLITSHQEELRVSQAKNKNLRKTVQELTEQLKIKDEELNTIRDQYKHLVTLSKDKHLLEREKLMEKVEELTDKLAANEGVISNLNRKLMLEAKSSKHKLNAEIIKNKQNQKEINAAMGEIDRLSSMLEIKSKSSGGPSSGISSFCGSVKRYSGHTPRQKLKSTMSLTDTSKVHNAALDTESNSSLPTMDHHPDTPETLKIESLATTPADLTETAKTDNKLLSHKYSSSSPLLNGNSSSFRARFSAKSQRSHRSSVDSLEDDYNNAYPQPPPPPAYPVPRTEDGFNDNDVYDDGDAAKKIEKLSKTLESVKMNGDDDNAKETTMADYCSGLVTSAQQCNEVVTKHTENYKNVQEDTAKLMESIQEIDALNKNLKRNTRRSLSKVNVAELDKIAKMTPDLQKINKNDLNFISDGLKNVRSTALLRDVTKTVEDDPVVTKEHKKKLLEALRAIDNGENVELLLQGNNNNNNNNKAKRKSRVMSDLFGDVKNLTGDL